jgi:hypothetical protein
VKLHLLRDDVTLPKSSRMFLEATADEAGESQRVQPQIASSQRQLAVHRSFSEAFLEAQAPTIG